MSRAPVPEVVLASASPRRRRLLGWLGLAFRTAAVDTPEDLDTPLADDPPALAEHLAAEKARAARADGHATSLLLCFDTIVVLDGAVLGKPEDDADAWRMLRALSGRTHEVVTGVALLCPSAEEPDTFSVTTEVRMKALTDCMIEAWMALGEYRGCAGAYNIEGQVAEVDVDQCYQNVAGLPLCHLHAALASHSAAEATSPGQTATPCVPGDLAIPIARCDAALCRTCELGPRVIARDGRGS